MTSLLEQAPDRDRQAYLTRHKDLLWNFDHRCRSLYGSELKYDAEGDMYYLTWRDLPEKVKKAGLLPPQYVIVSKLSPQADIFAPFTSFTDLKEPQVNRVTKDGGNVETAIRAMDHILEGERGRETAQTGAVLQRARDLFDLYGGKSFDQIARKEFAQERAKTFALLAEVGLDPVKVVNEHKAQMTNWLIAASSGQDATGRRNWLVATQALQAAYTKAVKRKKAIEGSIAEKFVDMRGALLLERQFCRYIFTDVAEKLRTMPLHVYFQSPLRAVRPSDLGIIQGMLNTMIFQLQQPHVKAYRSVANEAVTIIAQAVEQLPQGQRQAVIRQLTRREETPSDKDRSARGLLLAELERHKDIYPPKYVPEIHAV